MKDLAGRLEALDRQIREGKIADAQRALTRLLAGKLPREALAQAANFAWRLSDPAAGAKLLNRIVRPAQRRVVEATAAEKSEYAACLIKLGALVEAEKLLEAIDERDAPTKNLYRAFALVARWDYAGSIAPLKKYLATPGLAPYQALVGKVNLAAALVQERDLTKATYLLRELLHDLSVQGYRLLLTRTFLVAAEASLHRGRWAEAEAFLERGEAIVRGTRSLDHLFVRKFRAFAELMRDPASDAAARSVLAVREEAAARGHGETVRDCDRALAVYRRDEARFWTVYFGTPFPHLRQRMLDEFGGGPVPRSYDWSPAGGATGPVLDVAAGASVPARGAPLGTGQAPHRLLRTLASDFYQPFRIADLFAAMHPDEFYHPLHAPLRVRQVLTRLRQWLRREKLPLAIEEAGGGYRLTASRPCVLRVTLAAIPASREDALFAKLEQTVGKDTFTIREAARAWELSSRAALRVLEGGLNTGRIQRSGVKRGTRYRFAG